MIQYNSAGSEILTYRPGGQEPGVTSLKRKRMAFDNAYY